jgi:hypothetical protein
MDSYFTAKLGAKGYRVITRLFCNKKNEDTCWTDICAQAKRQKVLKTNYTSW